MDATRQSGQAEPPAEVSNGTSHAGVGTLIVWDYDWSLINTNSDTFVVEQLRPELMERFDDPSQESWTVLMDRQMASLFDLGVRREELTACVASVPAYPGCLAAARLAGGSEGVAQVVLSDANTVFIEAFLEGQGLRGLFREVITNPAEFDESGRLHVAPYHTGAPHGCPLCPQNLCKGRVLEHLRAALAPRRVVYVGDGGGDFCPACDLGPSDAVLCRTPPSPPLQHFGLHKRIQRSREGSRKLLDRRSEEAVVTAAVHPWHDGEDLLKVVEELLAAHGGSCL